jgi:putative tryptophan/tyrosine transport system ATP-binding protein
MLKITQATVTLGTNQNKKDVLRDINLTVQEGEFVVVIGNNGAGKSTLLNLISGDAQARTGNVTMANTDVTTWPSYKRASLVAKVLQNPTIATIGNLTVAENLAFALERGKNRSLQLAQTPVRREFFRKKLATLGMDLELRLDDPAEDLSGGQRQVLSLVMATLSESNILLLDEHTAALDPKTAALTMRITNDVIKQNKLTALMITHNMADALAYGDRTLFLQNGTITREFSPDEKKALTPADLAALFSQ